MKMWCEDPPSADQQAFQALDAVTRADLLLRLNHAARSFSAPHIGNRHYETPVHHATWLIEDLKTHGLHALAEKLEAPTDRLRKISDHPSYGRQGPKREMARAQLSGGLSSGFYHVWRWHQQALSDAVSASVEGIDNQHDRTHARYMARQETQYDTHYKLPRDYRGFMFATSEKVRTLRCDNRALRDIVTRTQTLFEDIAARNPHELAQWYLAANGVAGRPDAWHTLFEGNRIYTPSLPGCIVQELLHYSPESGLRIEQDIGAAMDRLRVHTHTPKVAGR